MDETASYGRNRPFALTGMHKRWSSGSPSIHATLSCVFLPDRANGLEALYGGGEAMSPGLPGLAMNSGRCLKRACLALKLCDRSVFERKGKLSVVIVADE